MNRGLFRRVSPYVNDATKEDDSVISEDEPQRRVDWWGEEDAEEDTESPNDHFVKRNYAILAGTLGVGIVILAAVAVVIWWAMTNKGMYIVQFLYLYIHPNFIYLYAYICINIYMYIYLSVHMCIYM